MLAKRTTEHLAGSRHKCLLLCMPHRNRISNSRRLASFRSYTSQGSSSVQKTHYEFFPESIPSGPPPRGPFSIDLARLRKEFLQLQAKAHPDKFPGEQKRKAEALSARINEAYKTLQIPLARAQYLLSLRGLDVAEDETAKVDDPELLMEVLDAREQIESANDQDELAPLQEENERRMKQSLEALEEAFAADNVERAKNEAVKLRYWANIKESIDAWERGKPVVLVH